MISDFQEDKIKNLQKSNGFKMVIKYGDNGRNT